MSEWARQEPQNQLLNALLSARGEEAVSEKRKYDSTVARIAGNIASGLMAQVIFQDYKPVENGRWIAAQTVALARLIIAEVERTEPLAQRSPSPSRPIPKPPSPTFRP
jgi:hypothetical protein